MPTIARFNVTPVKGTALQHPEWAVLGRSGIAGNRRFFLVDERGQLFSGDVRGQLVQVRSSVDDASGFLRCEFPDGSRAEGRGNDLGEACETDFYGRRVPGHHVRGPFDDAFSIFVDRPVRLVRTDRDGDGPDIAPLTLLSFASVAELGRRGGYPGQLSSLRFRINLEIDGCGPFEEDGWDGQRVRVGEAVIRLRGQIPRCVVTTHDPATGVRDWNTLKQIASFRPLMPGRQVPFGMYADVEEPGEAAVGAEVVPLGI
jgi:hypothetical protein